MSNKPYKSDYTHSAVSLLTGAALLLPGLGYNAAFAAEEDSVDFQYSHYQEDSVDFQYSHYQEGRRDGISATITNPNTGVLGKYAVPNNHNPIEVDSLHGSGRVSLTDRIKFAFNYNQDTWSGATPYGSAPEQSGANKFDVAFDDNGQPTIAGASPIVGGGTFFDSNNNLLFRVIDPVTGQASFLKDRTVHVLASASRKPASKGILNSVMNGTMPRLRRAAAFPSRGITNRALSIWADGWTLTRSRPQ